MDTYRYEGVPLTPTVMAGLITELAPEGVPVTRAELLRLATEHHESGGGLPTRGSSVSTVKKALQQLQEAGRAEQLAVRGYWRIKGDALEVGVDHPIEEGEGDQTLYVYFFPAYRDQAAHLGRKEWPVKIGMTASESASRIRDQIGTAMPEKPMVGLLYRTDDAAGLERLVHSTLKARGKHLTGAPGKEWFMSSVQEIRDIIEFATGSVRQEG